MTLRFTPGNPRTFTAGELRQFPSNSLWLGDWPAEATVEIHSVDLAANRFCWRTRWAAGSSDGCGQIQWQVVQAGRVTDVESVVIPGVLYDAAALPFFRVDNPVLWIGGLTVLGIAGYFGYRYFRRRR